MDIVTYLRGRASLADPLETMHIKIGLISVIEAADEIERLRKDLNAARAVNYGDAAYTKLLEQNNKRLREALRDIASGRYTGVMLPSHPPKDPAVERARAALGEEK